MRWKWPKEGHPVRGNWLVVLDTATTSHKRGCESNGGVLLREMQRGQGSQVREKGEDLLMGVYRAARDDG